MKAPSLTVWRTFLESVICPDHQCRWGELYSQVWGVCKRVILLFQCEIRADCLHDWGMDPLRGSNCVWSDECSLLSCRKVLIDCSVMVCWRFYKAGFTYLAKLIWDSVGNRICLVFILLLIILETAYWSMEEKNPLHKYQFVSSNRLM